MTSPGQELRKEREARGISLKAVADATRVTLRYLEAVESDRLDLLPGGFFVKGILKAYAAAVGLDETAVLEKYRSAGVLRAAGTESQKRTPPDEGEMSKKRARSKAWAAAALIVIVSFGAYFLLRPDKKEVLPTEIQPTPGTPAKADVVMQEIGTAPAAVAPVPEKGIKLEISFVQETWIQVYADGRLALDGIRLAGNTAEVRAAGELLIHLGNAGGVTYALNGKPGKSFGRPGAVVKNIRITEENLASFVGTGAPGET